jgi:tetraacyldisaccharide 4'-kinase
MLMDWSKIHEQDRFMPTSVPLAALSFLYGLAVKLRAAMPRTRKELPGFVVSLGNLTAGGTGKTPAAVMLAEWALDQGHKPAILSRGYGGKSRQKVLEVSDGHAIFSNPVEAGDEPYLLARKLKGVPVIISRARYDAGLYTHEKHGTDFFILDDGFQHIGLARDLDIVLLDASRPFGNLHLLPWGPLREPVNHLARADAFILTRSVEGSTPTPLGLLKQKFPEKPLFRSQHMPRKIFFPRSWKTYGPAFLTGKRVAAFSGIAKPEQFRDTLTKLGAEILSFKGFPDHHPFSRAEIEGMILSAKTVDCLITTEKDWVRIENLGVHEDKLCFLTIKFELLAGKESFFNLVEEKVQGSRRTGKEYFDRMKK